MPNHAQQLDRVFHALADPTRRAVIRRLSRGSASASVLARPFGMALPSFMQHLGRLEDCGLVTSTKAGRVRTYALSPKGLASASDWLDLQRTQWNRRLDQLDAVLTTMKGQRG